MYSSGLLGMLCADDIEFNEKVAKLNYLKIAVHWRELKMRLFFSTWLNIKFLKYEYV